MYDTDKDNSPFAEEIKTINGVQNANMLNMYFTPVVFNLFLTLRNKDSHIFLSCLNGLGVSMVKYQYCLKILSDISVTHSLRSLLRRAAD